MPTPRLVRFCFFSFTIAQIITLFGDRLHQFSIVGMIGRVDPGSSLQLAQFALFAQAPLVLAPVLGSLIDRSNKFWVLVLVDIGRGLIVLGIPAAFYFLDNLYAFYVPVLLLSLGNMLFSPAKSAIIPEIFGSLRLLKINSLLWSLGVVGTLGGFIVGGWLFDFVSWKWGFYADGISYLVSVLFLLPMWPLYRAARRAALARPPSPSVGEGPENPQRDSTGIIASIREGLSLVRSNRPVASALAVQTAAFGSLGALYVVGIAHVQAVFPADKTIYLSIVGSSGTAGLLIGAGVTILLRNHLAPHRFIAHSTLVAAAAWVGLASSETLIPITVWMLIMGVSISPVMVLTETLLQERTPDAYRGRVFSTREVLTRASFLAMTLAGTAAGAFASKEAIMLFLGVLLAMTGMGLQRRKFLKA